jgi:importin-7
MLPRREQYRCDPEACSPSAGDWSKRVQICELLSYFTYFTKPLTPRLWAFWPLLHDMVVDWGQDYVESEVLPLENLIAHGADTFATCEAPNYRESLWAMLNHHLARADADELEVKFLAKLMDVALLNCRGRLDAWLWPYLRLALGRLPAARNPGFATLLMNVLPSALVYDAAAALATLEAHGQTAQVWRRSCAACCGCLAQPAFAVHGQSSKFAV